MVNVDIRTRVELKNETQRERVRRGTAGRVALIGAFPSGKQKPFAAETFAQIVSHYGVKLNSSAVSWYGGVRAARRIFMEGIRGMSGANSVTCVNICGLRPDEFVDVEELYAESSYEAEQGYIYQENKTSQDAAINNPLPYDETKYKPPAGKTLLKADLSLTFDKLKRALYSIADEDMDMLFIANDLWEIFDNQATHEEAGFTGKPTRGGNPSLKTDTTNDSIEFSYKIICENKGTATEPKYEPVLTNGKLTCAYDTNTGQEKQDSSLPSGHEKHKVVFLRKYKDTPLPLIDSGTLKGHPDLSNTQTIKHLVWQNVPMVDKYDLPVYGETDTGKLIHNIGDVYDFLLDFVDNEFTNHRPVNYIGAIKTKADAEGLENDYSYLGIGSNRIRVRGERKDIDSMTDGDPNKDKYTPSKDNPYADITVWGAEEIAKLFERTTNELSTCGLFYQRGIINGTEVDEMELAAHMCGWICSINIAQDLTYQTIPGLTEVEEEPYLGANDAGTLLNEAGIQIIRPKSRLDRTFYVNNSIQPAGWHTNHIRSVTYLLKRLQFETGLGINNFTTNLEAYRAMLDTTAKEVLEECDVIRAVSIGEVEVINNYHIYVPISITLAGVVTLINIGVSMALDETGKIGTFIKTTSGYSMSI